MPLQTTSPDITIEDWVGYQLLSSICLVVPLLVILPLCNVINGEPSVYSPIIVTGEPTVYSPRERVADVAMSLPISRN